MRVTSARLAALVERTLREERQLHHQTTLKNVTDRVVTYISRHGGFQAFGISNADILMALRAVAAGEVKHQFKQGLPENTYGHVLPSAPPPLVQLMRGLPQWIAISEGVDATWVYTLDATPEQWQACADMKLRKAEQTLRAVDNPNNIARYLAEYGYGCLQDLLNGRRTT